MINRKRVFVFVILSLFAVSLLAGIVSAGAKDTIIDIIRPWEAGADIDLVVVKYLILILVWMVVWSVLHHIPGLSTLFKGWATWLGIVFSFIVAFLALAYITPEEIQVIMASYAGLGFAIGGLLPAVIIMAWTFDMGLTNAQGSDAKRKLSSTILVWVIWLVFGITTFYKLARIFFNNDQATNIFIYGSVAIVVLCAIMIFGGVRWVNNKLGHYYTKEQIDVYKGSLKKQTDKLKADVEALEEATTRPTRP